MPCWTALLGADEVTEIPRNFGPTQPTGDAKTVERKIRHHHSWESTLHRAAISEVGRNSEKVYPSCPSIDHGAAERLDLISFRLGNAQVCVRDASTDSG